jgi:hypothetical protein
LCLLRWREEHRPLTPGTSSEINGFRLTDENGNLVEIGEVSIAGVPNGPAVVAAALAIGSRGEQLVRGAFNIGSKVQTFVNGRLRIPDGTLPGTITEIKNVAYQPLTRQLQDYLQIAARSGAQLDFMG